MKAAVTIAGFSVFPKRGLATIFHFIGHLFYFACSRYASIVADASVQELSTIIILAPIVMAIAEATVPELVNSQPYILSLGGLIGFLAAGGFISKPFFWLVLSGLYCYSRFVKEKDNVSAALPMAAVAIGAPWVRLLPITSFLALAIHQQSKSAGNSEVEVPFNRRRLPLPLFFSALTIGLHVTAKWLRYWHLKWKAL